MLYANEHADSFSGRSIKLTQHGDEEKQLQQRAKSNSGRLAPSTLHH